MINSFTIAGIIQSIDSQVYCYDTTYRTFNEATTFTSAEMDLIVVFLYEGDDSPSYKFVDVAKILKVYSVRPEYITFDVHTWEDLEKFVKALYDYNVGPIKRGTLLAKYLTHSPCPRYQHYKATINGTERECMRVTPFTSNLKQCLKIVSLGYTNKIEGSYVNKDFPEIRNLPHRRISMPDIVFTKTDVTFPINFKNTLVSVDGIVCYPIYSEDTNELYACNGARMLKNTTDSNSLNILLIDFSNLGNITNYKLSECLQELIIKIGDKVYSYDDSNHVSTAVIDAAVEMWQQSQFSLKFKLPIGAETGTPILSLAGRLFFPGVDDLRSYTEGGYITIEFHISCSVLENIVASNLQHQNLFYKKSTLFRVMLTYVFSNLFTDQAYVYDDGSSEWKAIQFYMDQIIPFITVIHTDKKFAVDKVTPTTVFSTGKLLFPKNSTGLLLNMDTREMLDYTVLNYQNQTLVTYSVQHPLFITKRDSVNTNKDVLYSEEVSYADVMANAPEDIDIEYNIYENRFKLFTKSREHESNANELIYAESETNPFVYEGPAYKNYNWASVRALSEEAAVYSPVKNIWYLPSNGSIVAVSEYDENHSQGSYGSVVWHVLKDYQNVKWTKLWDGTNVVPDGVRFDRMAWQENPSVYKDPYNKFEAGEFIKNPRHYALLDLVVYEEEGTNLSLLDRIDNPEGAPDEHTDNPMVPVLTAEYEKVRDPLLLSKVSKPYTITDLKVSPTMTGGTRVLNVTNAGHVVAATQDQLYSPATTYYKKKIVDNRNVYEQITFQYYVGGSIPADTVYEKNVYTLTADTKYVKGKTYYTYDSETQTYNEFTVLQQVGDAITIFPLFINDGTGYKVSGYRNYVNNVAFYTRSGLGTLEDPYTYTKLKIGQCDIEGTLYEYHDYVLTSDTMFQNNKIYYINDNGKYKSVPVQNGLIDKSDTTYVMGQYSPVDGQYNLDTTISETGLTRIWKQDPNEDYVIKHKTVYDLTTDLVFKASKTYYTASGNEYTVATVVTGEDIPANRFYDTSKSYWAIVNSTEQEIFKTDYAGEGSAPYNSNLTWRLA